jgi:DNA-binding GntR family transcriptional regulator
MTRLRAVHDVSLADQAKEAIRTAILDGTIKPEERITIEQIAAELGISRTPVREALKALEMDGLVRLLPHRGAVVEKFARAELGQRYAIRAMLEGYAAELACIADAAGIATQLECNCVDLERLAAVADVDDPEQVRPLGALNQEFHRIIREGSQSATLIRLLETLRNPFAFTLYYWGAVDRQRSSIAIHREITAAFRAGKPSLARRLVERHLLEARDHLMEMEQGREQRKPAKDLAVLPGVA